MSFAQYSERHRHFLSDELPPLLERAARRGVVADIGCGDGSNLYALDRRGLLEHGYALDLSPVRVARATSLSQRIDGWVADATSSGLPDSSVDGVIVSQVIEHLDDDRMLAPEIARVLKPGGWFYVGSVARKPWGWWIYRRDGKWWLDPTHVREYPNARALAQALDDARLSIGDVQSRQLFFPVTDLALRVLGRLGAGPTDLSTFYVTHRRARSLRRLRVPVPGYSLIEVSGVRRTG